MLAMILSLPPQRAQASISMPKTRLSRRAQFIATWRGVCGFSSSTLETGCFGAPAPRCAGVTAARNLLARIPAGAGQLRRAAREDAGVLLDELIQQRRLGPMAGIARRIKEWRRACSPRAGGGRHGERPREPERTSKLDHESDAHRPQICRVHAKLRRAASGSMRRNGQIHPRPGWPEESLRDCSFSPCAGASATLRSAPATGCRSGPPHP